MLMSVDPPGLFATPEQWRKFVAQMDAMLAAGHNDARPWRDWGRRHVPGIADTGEDFVLKTWDESEHPRVPAGGPDGGQFTEAGGGDGGSQEAGGKLPAYVVQAFTELGNAQRGRPEAAMLKVQFANGGGRLNPLVEHTGDLTHRMTEMSKYGDAGYDAMKEKVPRLLRQLDDVFALEREIEENFKNNAEYKGVPVDELKKKVYDLMDKYADEHLKLTVYNKAQWLARAAAVLVGQRNYQLAWARLQQLDEMMPDRATWTRHAFEYKLNERGWPEEYSPSMKAWDESEHPRHPAGSSEGGQFTESGSGGVGGGELASTRAGGEDTFERAPSVYADMVGRIRAVLTPDLLSRTYRHEVKDKSSAGHCYAASEAAYHMLGGKGQGWKPMVLTHTDFGELAPGKTYWFVQHSVTGEVIDPAGDQFNGAVPYERARGKGFLTAKPSARAAEIIKRVTTAAPPDPALGWKVAPTPKKTVSGYKLFRVGAGGKLYPTQVVSRRAVPVGVWLAGEMLPTKGLAPRPGWHMGELPMSPQQRGRDGRIGQDRVWARVELPADVEWQSRVPSRTGGLRWALPTGGYYRFPFQGRDWLIGGALRVKELLSDAQVADILTKAGFPKDAAAEQHRKPRMAGVTPADPKFEPRPDALDFESASQIFKEAGISLNAKWGTSGGERQHEFWLSKWGTEGKEKIDPSTLSPELKAVFDRLETNPQKYTKLIRYNEFENNVRDVVRKLNYPLDRVKFSRETKTFELGGSERPSAAEVDIAVEKPVPLSDKPEPLPVITVYTPTAVSSALHWAEQMMAHEIMHVKFHYLQRLYATQWKEITDKTPAPDLTHGVDTVMNTDGSLKEPYASKYPVYQAWNELVDVTGPDGLARKDGVTDYSRDWWKEWADGRADTFLAIHETLAEMASLKAAGWPTQFYGPQGQHAEKPKPTGIVSLPIASPKSEDKSVQRWFKLYDLVESEWDKMMKARA